MAGQHRGVSLAVSFLLLEEYFATGDDRFVDALREFHVAGTLATIADKWKKDPRPWSRQQVFRYLGLPMNAPAHHTVVKRLFKYAEEQRDDELMAAFAVAFDGLVRRERRSRWRWDAQTRQMSSEEVLRAPRNNIPPPVHSAMAGPVVSIFREDRRKPPPGARLFSYHTRYYLRRRAWRYFRRLGFSRPSEYAAAVVKMLQRYRDDDFARGENVLDNWSLLHACFGKSDVLEFGASHAKVRNGRALRELVQAPVFPELWQTAESGQVLFELVLEARSRLVRVWAIQLLRSSHSDRLRSMPTADILRLLDHSDEEVQSLGAELLEHSLELDKLPVSAWLDLLNVRSPMVLETICRLMSQHVRAERVDLPQSVHLACARPVPVARLGMNLLRDREIRTEEDRESIARLADAKCASAGEEMAQWALSHLGREDAYGVERVGRFFDSLLHETREGAWGWLAPDSRGWNDPELWSRLVETPYDDVRLRLVRALEQRTRAPKLGNEHLSTVWCAVLLGIHRGGRHKLIALHQISRTIREHPEAAELLLPVLAVAIRSVRPPEARAGLAAVVAAVEARPQLTSVVARVLPELEFVAQGTEA